MNNDIVVMGDDLEKGGYDIVLEKEPTYSMKNMLLKLSHRIQPMLDSPRKNNKAASFMITRDNMNEFKMRGGGLSYNSKNNFLNTTQEPGKHRANTMYVRTHNNVLEDDKEDRIREAIFAIQKKDPNSWSPDRNNLHQTEPVWKTPLGNLSSKKMPQSTNALSRLTHEPSYALREKPKNTETSVHENQLKNMVIFEPPKSDDGLFTVQEEQYCPEDTHVKETVHETSVKRHSTASFSWNLRNRVDKPPPDIHSTVDFPEISKK
jgi:hypothetical protein